MHLMWNVLKPFAKIVLTPFWLRAAAPATDAAIQNKTKKKKKKEEIKKNWIRYDNIDNFKWRNE